MKKKVIALLLATTMAFSLAACGGGGNNQGGDNSSSQSGTEEGTDESGADSGEKILSVQIGPDPETIDPALNSAVDGGNMLLHSFECLLIVDQDGQLAPGQAETSI